MGSSVKKLVSGTTKVATLGLSDLVMGGGKDPALKAQEAAAAAQRQQEIAMRNQQQLADANAVDNVVDVQTGGDDMTDTLLDSQRKKKIKATTSSQLGIT